MTGPLTIRTVICGLDQLDLHSASRVTHVLSILDPGFPEPDAFKAYGPHARTSLRFHDEIEPGPDRILPQANDIETILSLGRTMSEDIEKGGKPHMLVHCQMGISRSTAATAILLLTIHRGTTEDDIFARLLELRPNAWPNCLMIELADELLHRHGRFTAAAGRLYTAQLAKRPESADFLRRHGRGREVDMAARSGSLAS
jgi:predicted protein tyrosine phosphatase